MIDFNIFEYYKQAKNQNILVSFKGALSQEILVEMGDFIRLKLSMDKKIKKIFSVFVELAQNIMRYSAERETVGGDSLGVGIILFTEQESSYVIYSGNLIEKNKESGLIEALESLEGLSKSELKKKFTEKLKMPSKADSKGAGLGLMEISKKADYPIEYQFYDYGKENSFFGMKVKINKGEEKWKVSK